MLERAARAATEERLGLLLTGVVQAVTVDPAVEDAVRASCVALVAGGLPVIVAGASVARPPGAEILVDGQSIDVAGIEITQSGSEVRIGAAAAPATGTDARRPTAAIVHRRSGGIEPLAIDAVPAVNVEVSVDDASPGSAADYASLLVEAAAPVLGRRQKADLVVLTGTIAGPTELVRPLIDPDIRSEVLERLRGVPRSTLPPVWWNAIEVALAATPDEPPTLSAASTVRGDLGVELDTVSAELDPTEGRLGSALAALPAELRDLADEPAHLVRRARALVDHLQDGPR